MKTTYLFKCHGAWSPLWIGHEHEKSFEVKDDPWAGLAYNHITFSEYHDPNSYAPSPGVGVLPLKTVERLYDRGTTLFGQSEARDAFFDLCLTGKLVVVTLSNCKVTMGVRP